MQGMSHTALQKSCIFLTLFWAIQKMKKIFKVLMQGMSHTHSDAKIFIAIMYFTSNKSKEYKGRSPKKHP